MIFDNDILSLQMSQITQYPEAIVDVSSIGKNTEGIVCSAERCLGNDTSTFWQGSSDKDVWFL
jgi:hypothetical protein